MRFHGVTLVLPDRLLPGGWLHADPGTGRIVALGGPETTAPDPAGGDEDSLDGRGQLLLAPGFIDAHVHGAVGRDTMEAAPDAWEAIARFHACAGGTTALALTTVASPWGDVREVLRTLREWRHGRPRSAPPRPRLLGLHLEGPFLSPARAGAHAPAHLRTPAADPATVAATLAAADRFTQVTLAPELPGAAGFTSALRARGVLVSAGHSDALEDELPPGTVRHVTHLFNAMSAARRQGAFRRAGLTETALADPAITCELIADGRHVSPALLRLAWRAKGADGLCLVTDATAGAGLPEGARYQLGALDCFVHDGVGMTDTTAGPALAGSTATMLRCVRNMVLLAGATVPEAVRMATVNPARALNLAGERGRLAVGLAADLVVLDPGLTEVRAVFIAGRRLG